MEERSAPSREMWQQHSHGPLLRTLSATLAGGAATSSEQAASLSGDPEAPTEQTPISRTLSARRLETRTQVTQRLMEEFMRHATMLCIFAAIFVVLLVALIYCFIGAILAAINYSGLPCDQPLRWYVWAVIMWSQFPGEIVKCLQNRWSLGPYGTAAAAIACNVPGWLLIAWGVYMVNRSETCHETNPELFYKTRNYIYAQVGFAVVLLFISAYSVRSILLLINRLNATPGCEKAVHKLEKVTIGSADLRDAEDGQEVDCPICLDSLADARTVVRAPCKHCFHEECLATWCSNHLDCPCCRQRIGEPDDAVAHGASPEMV